MIAANDNPSNSLSPGGSVIELDPWQRRFFDDDDRVICCVWHRQAGKDFTAACKAVDHALRSGQAWYIVSLTQGQADATFDKCRDVARIYQEMFKVAGEAELTEEEYDEYCEELDETFRFKAKTIHLPGGGSVTALPGRDPNTIAGRTGNIIFTEFGLFPQGGAEHWRTVFPLATRGFQIFVISTPRSRNHKFYELVSNPETYSVHIQTIEDSVREGFVLKDNKGNPCSIEAFKKLYGDETGWKREYMCEFVGDLQALVAWAKLMAAADSSGESDPHGGSESSGESEYKFDILTVKDGSGWKLDFFASMASEPGRAEIGWDVARHNDLSVLWINIARGDVRTLRYMVVMINCSFAIQREIAMAAMDARPDSVGCGDATGLGMDSNETLATKYPDRWQPVTFTAKSKAEMGSLAVTAFDDQDQRIPPMSGETKWIGADIYAVQADKSGDRLKLISQENALMPQSHCDAAMAFCLARMAAGMVPEAPFMSTGN